MQTATLLRTRSGPLPSPVGSLDHEAARSLFCRSPHSPLHPTSVHLKDRRFEPAVRALRRTRSEANLRAGAFAPTAVASQPAPATTEEDEALMTAGCAAETSPILSLGFPALLEEVEFGGGGCGGAGGGRKAGGRGRGGGGGGDPRGSMGAYYKQLLSADPENPLLLLNYGKFLQEVEGDLAGAEDCYGRAILANPGDGEALSRYGNLMWEAHHDEERAEGYFQRAVEASPEDCYVLGSYAHFLWDAEEDEEGSGGGGSSNPNSASSNAYMVEAF